MGTAACVEEEHVSPSAQEHVQGGLRGLSLENRSLVARRALLLDTWQVSVWKTLNSLTGPQRARTRAKEKEFPLEKMGEFADSQDPDRSGCPRVRGSRTSTGQQTTGPGCKREDRPIPAGTAYTHSAVLFAPPLSPVPALCLPTFQLPKQVPGPLLYPDPHLLSHSQSSAALYLSVRYCPLLCVPGKATGLQTRLPTLPPSPHPPRCCPKCCRMGYSAFPGSQGFPQAGTMCTLLG